MKKIITASLLLIYPMFMFCQVEIEYIEQLDVEEILPFEYSNEEDEFLFFVNHLSNINSCCVDSIINAGGFDFTVLIAEPQRFDHAQTFASERNEKGVSFSFKDTGPDNSVFLIEFEDSLIVEDVYSDSTHLVTSHGKSIAILGLIENVELLPTYLSYTNTDDIKTTFTDNNDYIIAGTYIDSITYLDSAGEEFYVDGPGDENYFIFHIEKNSLVKWSNFGNTFNDTKMTELIYRNDNIYLLMTDSIDSQLIIYDSDRNSRTFEWENTQLSAMQMDLAGNLYLSGSTNTEKSVDFDFSDDSSFLLDSGNGIDGILMKYNDEMEFDWLQNISGPMYSNISSFDVDSNENGRIFITGSIQGESLFGGTESVTASLIDKDMFVARYNYGAISWVSNYQGVGDDTGTYIRISSDEEFIFNLQIIAQFEGDISLETEQFVEIFTDSFSVSDNSFLYFTMVDFSETSVDDILPNVDITIAPNPTSETIKLTGDFVPSVDRYSIVNNSGKLIRSADFENSEIDIRELNTGMYFLKLYSVDGVVVKRIVKL